MNFYQKKLSSGSVLVSLLLFSILLTSCSFFDLQSQVNPVENNEELVKYIFNVKIPAPVSGEQIDYALEIVDEISGLSLNSTRYLLLKIDPTQYFTEVSFPPGRIIKYRFVKLAGIPMVETISNGESVRYRLLRIDSPMVINDIVASWEDQPYQGAKGKLEGHITSPGNIPVPALMVIVAGQRTITNSEGFFEINEIPVGLQRISIFSLDGSMPYFQQEAVIGENATTPVNIQLTPNKIVTISFNVTVPEGDFTGIPIRIVGDLYQLGNTFSDLKGGISVIASRSPALMYQSSGKYTFTISLPEGTYFSYRYTLGDGFWNSERTMDGKQNTRELIVPGEDLIVNDLIGTWNSPGYAPITFRVSVPQNTPVDERVSIQFNPYGWMESIPMWSLGNNQWYYVLYNPIEFLGKTEYRYCRNDQCMDQSHFEGDGKEDNLFSFMPSNVSQAFQDTITSWDYFDNTSLQMVNPDVGVRLGEKFTYGYEMDEEYSPEWQPYWSYTFNEMRKSNAKWLFLSPTWTITQNTPIKIELCPGNDPLWQDTLDVLSQANFFDLRIALFPSVDFNETDFALTLENEDTNQRLESWFNQYRTFIINYADMAEISGAEILVIGGPEIDFSLADEFSINGISDPASTTYSRNRWNGLIGEIRARYKGKVYWAFTYPEDFRSLPVWVDELDGLYLLWNGTLAQNSTASYISMEEEISSRFTNEIAKPIISSGKPILIGMYIPSIDGASMNCVTVNGECRSINNRQRNEINQSQSVLDIQEQLDVYKAALTYFSKQEWFSGFISRGYFPPAVMIDKSASIHGKPAESYLKMLLTQ